MRTQANTARGRATAGQWTSPCTWTRGIASGASTARCTLVLFACLCLQSHHNAYAGITLPNAGSVALHERVGFEHIAVYHDVGQKVFPNSSLRSPTRRSNTTPDPHNGQ